jgi:hypothetical protein
MTHQGYVYLGMANVRWEPCPPPGEASFGPEAVYRGEAGSVSEDGKVGEVNPLYRPRLPPRRSAGDSSLI